MKNKYVVTRIVSQFLIDKTIQNPVDEWYSVIHFIHQTRMYEIECSNKCCTSFLIDS